MLLLGRDFGSREWFDAACSVAHIRPRVLLESAAPHTLIALAATGYGIAVIPSNAQVPRSAVRTVPLVHRGASVGRWAMIAWDPQRFLAPYAEQFVAEIVAHCRRDYPGRDLIRRALALVEAHDVTDDVAGCSFIGANVPVWDIADKFGDTNLLVTNMDHGRDLAKCLASNNVALMRGHGFASAGRSLIEVVRMSVYLPRNARALLHAKQLGGEIKYLRQGEIDARNRGYSPYSTETWRAWEYWARSMPAIAATAPTRRKHGGRGNTGQTRPAAATC